jgi:hypothetical protein
MMKKLNLFVTDETVVAHIAVVDGVERRIDCLQPLRWYGVRLSFDDEVVFERLFPTGDEACTAAREIQREIEQRGDALRYIGPETRGLPPP